MESEVLRDGYDVVVLGGGAAGLSGALMLARSRRSVLVVDAGAARNKPAEGVHGLLGLDGTPPGELLKRGRTEVRGYGGQVITGEVVGAVREGDAFKVSLADGRSVKARRLLVASGLVDELPDVPGVKERWGKDVLHCPYCHGWEVRDKAIGILASGPNSVHQALLFSQLSADVVYFTHTMPPPEDADAEKLAARGIRLVEGEVTGLEVAEDRLAGLRLAGGAVVPRQAVVVATRMVARTGFLEGLGLKAVDHPSGMGNHIPVDAMGRTEVPRIWAAGNVADLSAQVGAAASQGAFAAAQINFDLVNEETSEAVRVRRDRLAEAV